MGQEAQGIEGTCRLGPLLTLHVTCADEQERAQVEQLAAEVERITEENVELAYVDHGYTGHSAEEAAASYGIQLEVVKHTEAERGFVLLLRRWVAEGSFAWVPLRNYGSPVK